MKKIIFPEEEKHVIDYSDVSVDRGIVVKPNDKFGTVIGLVTRNINVAEDGHHTGFYVIWTNGAHTHSYQTVREIIKDYMDTHTFYQLT